MAEENNENNDRANRVRNMQGLLKFCTEVTVNEDATGSSSYQTLDPERRAFLEKVFADLQSGTVKELRELLDVLLSEAVVNINEDISIQEHALKQLAEYAPDLNHSSDIFKIGGFPIIIRCLSSPHDILRSRAAALIGDICQNDEKLQMEILQLDVLPMLLSMVDKDNDINCRIAALFGVSCLVRSGEVGEVKFVEADGLSYLMRAAQSSTIKLCIKSIFLLTNLIKKKKYTESIINMGFIEQLSSILNKCADDVVKEHTTNALLTLVEQSTVALQECLRTELYLIMYLQNRLITLKHEPEYQEETEYCSKLLHFLRTDTSDESCLR